MASSLGQKLLLLLQQAIPTAGPAAGKIEMRNAERQKWVMPTGARADESVPEFHNCVNAVSCFHIFEALELDGIRVYDWPFRVFFVRTSESGYESIS